MGSGVTVCAFLVCLVAFSGSTISRFTLPWRVSWVNLPGGVGILALFLSVLSAGHDRCQQELSRPASLAA